MEMTFASYKRLNFILSLLIVAANGFGAMLVSLYFAVIDPLPKGSSAVSTVNSQEVLYSIVGTSILLFTGAVWANYVARLLPKWTQFLFDGGDASQIPEQARRSVLNYPLFVSIVCLAMWFIAGTFFSAFELRGFLITFGIGGILTSAIVYFAVEYLWRPMVPIYFPRGELYATRAFRLTVLGRLLVTFMLITFYPVVMLAGASLNRARVILSSPNPQTVIQNLVISIIFIMVIGIMASMGLAVLVTRLITRPLNDLQDAMSRVQENDLTVHVPVYSNDEIGYLSERFNAMVNGLRRGELLRNLLNLYVSPEVARQALEHGTQLGGQAVECTVLFSDIRGFTSISEQLSPEVLMDLLNRYMSTMVDVIVANRGMVNKFGGDSLLAVFGTPLNPSDDHAWRAVRTALDMRAALLEFNQSQIEANQPELKIGIGIATGKVVAGNIGGQERIEYTVIGDTVNLASRLQSLTKETGRDILINEATYNAVQGRLPVKVQPLPPLDVRGKKEPVNMFGVG